MPPKGPTIATEDLPMPPDAAFGEPAANARGAEGTAQDEPPSKKPNARDGNAVAQDEPPSNEAQTPAMPEIAALDFVGDGPDAKVTLSYPFKLDGALIGELEIRRLTLGQVRHLTERARSEDGIDMVDLWAELTGLPAPVIRGLKDEDGEELADAAADFLPRVFRGDQPSG